MTPDLPLEIDRDIDALVRTIICVIIWTDCSAHVMQLKGCYRMAPNKSISHLSYTYIIELSGHSVLILSSISKLQFLHSQACTYV